MKQFLLIAYDGQDEDAPARRQAARTAHLDGITRLKATGNFISGGAILNEAGVMIGSACFMAFENRTAFDAWLATDPYIVGDVWRDIMVKEMRLAGV